MYRPDAQGFDEIRITTVPRYKESGLSGDEWRISAKVELMCKGEVLVEETYGTVESAAKFLPWLIASSQDDGKCYYAGIDGKCDQEGCAEEPTVFFKLKQRFCVGGGNCGQEIKQYGENYRKFCDKHKRRGDCGLEDADSNYEAAPNH